MKIKRKQPKYSIEFLATKERKRQKENKNVNKTYKFQNLADKPS